LEDTRLALDECSIRPVQQDYSTAIFTGIGGVMFGFLVGSLIKR